MLIEDYLSQPYWIHLAALSLAFLLIERLRPWRRQSVLRHGFWTDILYLGFNGYLLALIMATPAQWLAERFNELAIPWIGRGHLADQPLWLQAIVVFFLIDFIKWLIHVVLHSVSWLWTFHRVHHSIVDMDWMGNMRFHWLEIVIYNGVLYTPMLLIGFDWKVLAGNAVFSTLMGHFNHSNLKVELGPLRYIFNHPSMHIWHHDHVMHYRAGCNFGINLSVWDWIFGTAYMPKGQDQPERLGFKEIEHFPRGFLSQQLVPVTTMIGRKRDENP